MLPPGSTDQSPSRRGAEAFEFDQYTLRFVIGAIAFLFPILVVVVAGQTVSSISWSYYTQSRDVFVGTLFALGALLAGYKGHKEDVAVEQVGWFWRSAGALLNGVSRLWGNQDLDFRVYGRRNEEDWISNLGAAAAIVVALRPTAYNPPPEDLASVWHHFGAFTLLFVVAYFALVAFMRGVNRKLGREGAVFVFVGHVRADLAANRPNGSANAEAKTRQVKYAAALRGLIYAGLGVLIILIDLAGLIWYVAAFNQPSSPSPAWAADLTWWGEFVAMSAFGLIWLVANQNRFFGSIFNSLFPRSDQIAPQ